MSKKPMPHRLRLSTGGLTYHVLNRQVGRLSILNKPTDLCGAGENFGAHLHLDIFRSLNKNSPSAIPEAAMGGKLEQVIGEHALGRRNLRGPAVS
ncbi:MAG: hypothetical protein R3B95_15145 [Nitrospirales bacterium]|nr:hypothetical protein [Nitrospirales bacterium]